MEKGEEQTAGLWGRIKTWAKGVNQKLKGKPRKKTSPKGQRKKKEIAFFQQPSVNAFTSNIFYSPVMETFPITLSLEAIGGTSVIEDFRESKAHESPARALENSLAPTFTLDKVQPSPANTLPAPTEYSPWNEEFFAYVDSFLKEQTSIHTRRAYEQDLIDFLGYLKSSGLPMNVHTLVKYRTLLQERTSSRTSKPLTHISINRKLACIKSFLNFLVLNGVLANNPAKAVKSFRAGRESPTRDIPDDAVRRMLALPDRHRKTGALHHLILEILFHMGLRRAELVGLRTSDLFEEGGIPVIRIRGKGDRERILPLPASVIQSIEHYFLITGKSRNKDEVLLTPEKNNVTKDFDKELNPNSIAYIVKRYAKKAGIEYRVSPHSARATAVSNALDHLAPHRSIQHMAGWTSPLMVARYDKRRSDLRNSGIHFITYD